MSGPHRVSRRGVIAPAAITVSLATAALFGLLAEESRPVRAAPRLRNPALAASPHLAPSLPPRFEAGPLGELPPWRESFAQLGPAWTSFVSGAPVETNATLEDGALSLAVDAQGADPTKVHMVGLVRRAPAQAGQGLVARVSLEWCAPPNASGRSAGLTLTCADPTRGAAESEPALTFEVVGVPPGHTARLLATARSGALRTPLFVDGWPATKGRAIDRVELELEWSPRGVTVRADGRELSRAEQPALRPTDAVWLMVHTSSQAGFGPRPVRVREVGLAPLGRNG